MKRLIRLFIPFILLTVFTFFSNTSSAQGWERTFGGNANDQAFSVIPTLDGGYALLGFSESNSVLGTNVILVKTDENGVEQWSQSFGGTRDDKGYELVQDVEGNYIIVGQTSSIGNGEDDVLLLKVNSKGEEIWQKAFGGPYNDRGFSLTEAKDGGYILTGRTELIEDESADVYLVRTDTDGNLLWEQNFGGADIEVGESVIEASDGSIVIVGENQSDAIPNPNSPNNISSDVYFIKTNAFGEILIEKTFGNVEEDKAFDVVETAEGNFALTGMTSAKRDLYLLMLDRNGAELWSKSYGGIFDEVGRSIVTTADGGFAIGGVKEITPTTSQMYLVKTDSQGALEWDRLFGSLGSDFGRSIALTPDGGYVLAGEFDINNAADRTSLIPLYDMYLVKTDEGGNIFNNTIQGTVHRDLNTNCEKDTDEKILEDWLVRVRGTEGTFYATTDENGEYNLTVKNGNYNVSLIVLNTAWEVCQNYNVAFTENDTMQLDFATRTTVDDCPILIVDVSTAILEPCRDADYTISLCNRGVEKAADTYIEVRFDPFLEVNYSTLPWTNHSGNVYRFDIGDLNIEECGSFVVNTTVSCDAAIGQGHCVEAYAYPDLICLPPSPLEAWNGASIKVEADCLGDSVQFIVKNIGGGDIGTPLGFIVIQDEVVFRQGLDFQLPSEGADTLYIPTKADVSSYRLIVEQPSGHPYGETASAGIEGCPFGAPFTTGFLTMFSDADALPFFSVDCQENKLIAGNADMTPSPKGVGETNNIANTDELEFHIYFQNTGSDTVEQVVIRDTLSSALDITTLVPGASSHIYDYQVSGTGVVTFTFSNINLLNEATKASESYGFVKFKIAQKRDNPAGMVIEHQATILFDFGAPIFTNPTFHTIGGETVEDFVEISTDIETVFVPNVEVKIAPNPFDANGATIELIGLENVRKVHFNLFDVAGRKVQQVQFNTNKFRFYPANLPQGLYIYTIRTEGGLVNTGKVFIK
ncbi:MAG: T9SS type A sorting domain-containing protein [Saprospiraceae bacterium]